MDISVDNFVDKSAPIESLMWILVWIEAAAPSYVATLSIGREDSFHVKHRRSLSPVPQTGGNPVNSPELHQKTPIWVMHRGFRRHPSLGPQ